MNEIRIIEDKSTDLNPYIYVDVDCMECGKPYNTHYNYKDGCLERYICFECECDMRGVPYYGRE